MSEPTTEPSRALALAVVLAAIAGFVDAHLYLHVVPVFVANQSGNLIGLGMAAGQSQWHDASSAVVAIGSFVAGVAFATRLQQRDAAGGRPNRIALLLAIEAVALVVLGLGLWVIDPQRSSGWRPIDLVVIVGAASAMGIQSASIRTVGSISVTTTYGSGALVRVGEKLLAPPGSAAGAESVVRVRTVVVLLVVLAGYVGGAAVSAALGSAPWLILVPALAMVAVAGVARR